MGHGGEPASEIFGMEHIGTANDGLVVHLMGNAGRMFWLPILATALAMMGRVDF